MRERSFRRIESDENAFYKMLKRLQNARGIRRLDSVLVSGPKTVQDLVRAPHIRCDAWITTDGHAAPPAGFPGHAHWYQLSRRLFDAVDTFGTDAPLLLIAAPEIARWDPAALLPDGCTLMVPFQDPENVGTVIRSAVAFGVGTVVLLAESAHPYHPRAVRASGGAVFHARLLDGPSVHDLPAPLAVMPLSPGGTDIATVAFPERFALLPGVEGPGLPEPFRARAISIPITPEVESLNAATATAIALYLWSRSRR